MAQWETEVPVDCVLEDQIGARSWQRDYNPAAPDVLSYSSGWYAHTQAYTGQCLMTELGWDRLANTEVGFHGSVLVGFMDGDGRWGAGNWSVYPLFGMLAGDKTLLYQHDLAHETMTDNKPVLTFNMSYGYMLSYNWMSADLTPANTPWFDIALSFQEAVASQYAGKQITSFSQPGPGLTQTGYDHLSVLANWDTAATYPTQGYEIAPQGFLAIDSDNSLLAGIFSGQFNGQALSAGEHYLIVRRSDRTVYVRQPLGEDTQLWVPLPKNWQAGERLVVGAYTHLGKYLGEVPYTLNGSTVSFRYQRTLGEHTVGYYQAGLVRRSYLPLAIR